MLTERDHGERSLSSAWRGAEVSGRYGRLIMPKCVIWGGDDRFFPAAEGRRLVDMLPEPKLFDVIPHPGLLVHEELSEARLCALHDSRKAG